MVPDRTTLKTYHKGYDRRCPESMNTDEPIPAEWQTVGVRQNGDGFGGSEIIYATPKGRTTWCEYTSALWDRQLAAVLAGDTPSAELLDTHRMNSLTIAVAERDKARRDEESAKRSAQIRAQVAEERRLREAEKLAAKQRQDEDEERRLEELERRKRDDAVVRLAAILVAQRSTARIASTQMCILHSQKNNAREELRYQRQVEAASGVVDKQAARSAGEQMVDADAEMAAITTTLRRVAKATPFACKGGVNDAVACRSSGDKCRDRSIYEMAWGVAQSLLDGENVKALEAEARSAMAPDAIAEAEARAAKASADLAK